MQTTDFVRPRLCPHCFKLVEPPMKQDLPDEVAQRLYAAISSSSSRGWYGLTAATRIFYRRVAAWHLKEMEKQR